MYAFRLTIDGTTYHGAWMELDGGLIQVRSPFGAQTAEVGSRDPRQVARQVLAGMIPPLSKPPRPEDPGPRPAAPGVAEY